MQIVEARPPYVTFEVRAEEDRDASIAAGHFVARDVDYAFITPQGSKDRIERVASEWLASKTRDVEEGRFPREWLEAYKGAYRAWKEGREAPLSGTPVVNWPSASPAQVKALLNVQVRTVEDLAAANEETISRLGMGGRALKQLAVEWLAASRDSGKIAAEVASLKARNEELESRNRDLDEKLNRMAKQLEALTPVPSKKL